MGHYLRSHILAVIVANIRVFKVPVLNQIESTIHQFFSWNATISTILFTILRTTTNFPHYGWY